SLNGGDIQIAAQGTGKQLRIQNTQEPTIIGGVNTTGNIDLSGDKMQFEGHTIQSVGQLFLSNFSEGQSMGIGTESEGEGVLDASELAGIEDGFSLITIGSAVTGNVDLDQCGVSDPLEVYGEDIRINGLSVPEAKIFPKDGHHAYTESSNVIIQLASGNTEFNGQVCPNNCGQVGQFRTNSNLQFNSGSTISLDMEASGDQVDAIDQFVMMAPVSTITLQDNVELDINLIGSISDSFSDEVVLFDLPSGHTWSGSFEGLDEGQTLTLGGKEFLISYLGGDGNDVTLIPNGNCPGDFDSDGIVNISDLQIFLAQYGCLQNCTVDLDNDGLIGFADLADFLTYYGTSCE
ncbi:MAG: hypothetical protein AAF193_00585, partial [Bacteroidota bacterium]